MKIQDIKSARGSNKSPKRVGRGSGSGHGKTSCRGHNGQNSRSGGGVRPGFEGGQMPLQRRLPKRGFKNLFRKDYAVLNLKDIDRIGLDEITPEALKEKGIIGSLKAGLKVLGDGEISRSITVKANAISASAARKIQDAGGSVEVI